MTRGLFFLLDDYELKRLKEIKGDPSRRVFAAEMEESWDSNRIQETDKAWYALHVMFLWGSSADKVLDRLFAGGTRLHKADFCLINLVERNDLPEINVRLDCLTKNEFRQAYLALDDDYFFSELVRSAEAINYTWHWFIKIRDFFKLANSHILFNAEYP